MRKMRPVETANYESCDINPWIQELLTRMEEARRAGTNVVNLSYSHPRSFFPNQIVRRAQIKDMLKDGWQYVRDENPPRRVPKRVFLPQGADPATFEWCDTTPWEQEIDLRVHEAWQEGQWVPCGQDGDPDAIVKWVPGVTDLTSYHPRGEIPETILKRIHRRKDPKWRGEMQEEIDRCLAEANQNEGRAKYLEQRAEAFATKPTDPGDPTALLQSAAAMRQKALELRERARLFKIELGER